MLSLPLSHAKTIPARVGGLVLDWECKVVDRTSPHPRCRQPKSLLGLPRAQEEGRGCHDVPRRVALTEVYTIVAQKPDRSLLKECCA